MLEQQIPVVISLFRKKKLRFFQKYTLERWKLFMGEDATVEDAKRELEGIEGVSYFVDKQEGISLEYVCPAVVKTRYGNLEAFANSLISERQNTLGELMTFEDGTPIEEEVVEEVKAVMEEEVEAIEWEAGDLVMIDNSRFLHGRNPFIEHRSRLHSCLSFLDF